jgi:FtsH-binding integral membrane protein
MQKFLAMLAVVVGAALAALVPALADNHIRTDEWLNVIVITAGAAAVFTAPNVPGHAYVKTALAVITAVCTLAVSLIVDGVSTAEIIQLVLAALGAVGVKALTNTGDYLEQARAAATRGDS